MKKTLSKTQSSNVSNILSEEYTSFIFSKLEKNMPIFKKLEKIEDENLIIPMINNYNDIMKFNFNLQQLKIIAKYYKLKISGNKKELVNRVYMFLYLSSYVIKIQKIFRGKIQRKYNVCHGPAFNNRNLCTNNTDFVTMDDLSELKYDQFFSYKDVDNFIYGFDIVSLYNLLFKTEKVKTNIKNPYNRNAIPDEVFRNIKSVIRISKLLNLEINLTIEENVNISFPKSVELRALSLFQNINSLGNYSDANWFLSLERNEMIKFVRELQDIWAYRAQLSIEVKRNICPPNGDPFRQLNIAYLHHEPDLICAKSFILDVLEKFVNSGVDRDSQSLGAYYVLGALTLVNHSAATSLPWLFQSLI